MTTLQHSVPDDLIESYRTARRAGPDAAREVSEASGVPVYILETACRLSGQATGPTITEEDVALLKGALRADPRLPGAIL